MSGPFTAAQIAHCWQDALALWDVEAVLSPPEPWSGKGQSHWSADEPLAYIDMETRQVVVNFALLQRMGAAGSLTGVLAHEVGHHVRFPHTLGLAAALQLMEKRLIPYLQQSLLNLFFDLLVNEFVGRTRADELIAVYRGFLADTVKTEPARLTPDPETWPVAPVFLFYLAVYEELWGRAPGALVPAALLGPAAERYPGFRSDARTFVQTFYALTSVFQQFAYFCSRFVRYIPDPAKLAFRVPLGHDVPQPDADDLDSVVRGLHASEVDEALRDAKAEGWLDEAGIQDIEPGDSFETIRRAVSGLPGTAQVEFQRRLVSQHYKRLVDDHLISIPPTRPKPEPFLPTVLEEWDWSESPRAIDWTGSILSQGPLAAVHPLRRDLDPDEPAPHTQDFPAVEIYLDTSGSMPDPGVSLNVMTLAAQILSASALRKRGIVRGAVYSWGPPVVSDWMYDEERARRFFLTYAGGGTQYPFPLLKRWARERSDVIRVIVSDSDFLANVTQSGAMEALVYATSQSRLLVAFLAAPAPTARKQLEPALRQQKFRLALVADMSAFAPAARRLADALFGSAA